MELSSRRARHEREGSATNEHRSTREPPARGAGASRRPEEFAANANAQAVPVRRGGRRPARVLGGAGAGAAVGRPVDRGARRGIRRSRSGSSAAPSTSRSTASTGTSSPVTATRSRYHWEGEPGDTRTITYADLKDEVCKATNALLELGVQKGDRVAIYMPMIPETAIAMLACARLGAPHSVVFGGFSADALKRPIHDADARLVITADGGYRRGAPSALKPAVDEALEECPSVQSVLVVRRTEQDVAVDRGPRRLVARRWSTGNQRSHEQRRSTPSTRCSSSTPRGTTAKPKGILHTTGGYLTQVSYTHRNVFDLKPDSDVYWCAADIGWVTGHSYIVYGPLSNGATSVMYEGTPDTPHKGRWWELVAEVRRDDPLHGADRDPYVHEVGRPTSRTSTTCRRCDCSAPSVSRSTPKRGCGTARTSAATELPDRRHLVADRDRRHHDQPAARRDRHEARVGDATAARHQCRRGRRRRRSRCRTAVAATSS